MGLKKEGSFARWIYIGTEFVGRGKFECKSGFFLGFTNGGFERGFAGFNSTAGETPDGVITALG